jgi:lipoate-protein ligase A
MDLTFSVIVEAEKLGSPIAESYRIVGEATAEALRSLGVAAEFIRRRTPPASIRGIDDCFKLSTEYELEVAGSKVLGSAQMRRAGYVLQQNSLAAAPGIDWPPKEKIAEAITNALARRIGSEFKIGELLPSEITRAEELVRTKYACDEWNVLCRLPEAQNV